MAASPNASPPVSRRVTPAWLGMRGFIAVLGLLVVFPPFRVVRRSAPDNEPAVAAPFDAPAFAHRFWQEQLLPAAAQAPELPAVLAAMRRDPSQALKQHARRAGIGEGGYYFVRGSGRIAAVEPSRLLVETEGGLVAVRTGPVFGNALRDGCGLLDVNQVPGLAEFNALAAALNHIVEEQVQPGLKSAAVTVGATVTFAGCAEAPASLPATGPLLLFIPIRAEAAP